MSEEKSKVKSFFNPISFVAILLIWNWLGGFLLDLFSVPSTWIGSYYLAGTLIWSLVFARVVNKKLENIGVTVDVKFDLKSLLLIILAALIGSVYLLLFAIFKYSLPLVEINLEIIITLIVLPVSILIQAFFEEIAWAGWLYSNLKMREEVKNLIIGLVWAVWHVPFYLWGVKYFTYTPLMFTLSIIGIILSRFVINWFRKEMNNVWWPTFYHGGINLGGFIIIVLYPGIEKIGEVIEYSGMIRTVIILILQIIITFVGKKREKV
ncbi:MAG: CPBP family intramembrane metalloprotease [Candidatus Heimdallarchaeum endolithica]|uniref:CPBP family intramembrane metalloprotease n=1 Tax=Candidatus Heimdallarchaeum endolithica TaxID=2876572 RepID=A0A9Y1BR78_9ARCH|nr:MAG: CPBP family intramembrane metalloprotease [Candidatus Heimdallarchaeum endolithica]